MTHMPNTTARWKSAAILLALAVAAVAAGRAEEKKATAAEYIGAQACIACHADREEFKKNIHARAWPKAKGIEFEKSCETCHGPGSLHAAAGGDKNNPDFFSVRNPVRLKAADSGQICLQCHSGAGRMHWKGSTHEMKNVSCLGCHSIHNAKNGGDPPLLLKGEVAETCYQCHAEKKAQIRKSAHMPLAEGKMSCTSCHNPHGSVGEKNLVKASVVETCYQCHQDKRGPFLWEHPPVRENCLNCHNPHGSHNDKMLVTKPPLLCQRCHSSTRHPSSLYDLTAINTGSDRIFNRGCPQCHSMIHGSNHPSGKFLHR